MPSRCSTSCAKGSRRRPRRAVRSRVRSARSSGAIAGVVAIPFTRAEFHGADDERSEVAFRLWDDRSHRSALRASRRPITKAERQNARCVISFVRELMNRRRRHLVAAMRSSEPVANWERCGLSSLVRRARCGACGTSFPGRDRCGRNSDGLSGRRAGEPGHRPDEWFDRACENGRGAQDASQGRRGSCRLGASAAGDLPPAERQCPESPSGSGLSLCPRVDRRFAHLFDHVQRAREMSRPPAWRDIGSAPSGCRQARRRRGRMTARPTKSASVPAGDAPLPWQPQPPDPESPVPVPASGPGLASTIGAVAEMTRSTHAK